MTAENYKSVQDKLDNLGKDKFDGVEKIPLKWWGAVQIKPVKDLHRLHVTIRKKKKLIPLKWFLLNMEKIKAKINLADAVKFKIINGGIIWKVDKKIFDSFSSYLGWNSDISEEAAELVKKFDKMYDLLIVDEKTKEVVRG